MDTSGLGRRHFLLAISNLDKPCIEIIESILSNGEVINTSMVAQAIWARFNFKVISWKETVNTPSVNIYPAESTLIKLHVILELNARRIHGLSVAWKKKIQEITFWKPSWRQRKSTCVNSGGSVLINFKL